MRALISVSDKTGIVEFARKLRELNIDLISTGGTKKALEEAGLEVTGVSEITGFPECLDGRVKTLHPAIHAGLLAMRSNDEHMKQLAELKVETIDMVVVNLYPFKETIRKEDVSRAECVENIDIGGPTMLRSAAKNYQDVSVIIDPSDYDKVIEELSSNGKVSLDTNFYLCQKVFEHTASYDTMIATYMRKERNVTELPETYTATYEKVQDMRYGENPHQRAAFYKDITDYEGFIPSAEQLHGKALSYNNINDLNGALELMKEFDQPCIVGCKHSNPAGVGVADNIYDAYMKAYNADPVSIFGGIIASNRSIDLKTAEAISKIFIEIVAAPDFDEDALAVLTKKKNIRLLKIENITRKLDENAIECKRVSGGIILQTHDAKTLDRDNLECVTDAKPEDDKYEDLLMAWNVVKHAKSNAIVICKDGQTLGVGTGQVSRIWACKQAIDHAIEYFGEDALKGAVLASDAFFPFPDCIAEAAKYGITSVIQPGGSKNDKLSVEECNKNSISMVLTSVRHFKHS